MTNRKSHTPFRLVPKSTTLDDLERQYALCCWKDVFRSPPQKKLNEVRSILSAQKCRPMTLVSGGIRFMRIFAEFLREKSVKRQWGCRQRQFSAFSLATSSESLEIRPTLLHSDMESLVGFSVQESPAVADKPARRLRKVCTVYVRAVGL